MYLLTEWECRTEKYWAHCHGVRTEHHDRVAKYFPVRPDLTQSISILSYDHRAFPFLFCLFVFFCSGNKIRYRNVGVYIATKLFQFASRKDPYVILAGLDGFFPPCWRHHVRPSHGDFLNSFAMKARAGPYGSYDPYIRYRWNVRSVI